MLFPSILNVIPGIVRLIFVLNGREFSAFSIPKIRMENIGNSQIVQPETASRKELKAENPN